MGAPLGLQLALHYGQLNSLYYQLRLHAYVVIKLNFGRDLNKVLVRTNLCLIRKGNHMLASAINDFILGVIFEN